MIPYTTDRLDIECPHCGRTLVLSKVRLVGDETDDGAAVVLWFGCGACRRMYVSECPRYLPRGIERD
jgi:hypothetical protein